MSPPMNIPISSSPSHHAVSTSPTTTSLHERFAARRETLKSPLSDVRPPKVLHPIENEDLKLLVLENISQDAVAAFRAQGFHVDHSAKAMSEDELVEKIGSYHAIGIRSKTKITQRVIQAASKVGLMFPSRI
jgi:D-3-phosphoglycerate dehydrogenase / 2-oxoglutarate reductase